MLESLGISLTHQETIDEAIGQLKEAFEQHDLENATVENLGDGAYTMTISPYPDQSEYVLEEFEKQLAEILSHDKASALYSLLKQGLRHLTTEFGNVPKSFKFVPAGDLVEIHIAIDGIGRGISRSREKMPLQWRHLAHFADTEQEEE